MTVGRFAPSPSGPLHLGSLVTALASYLDVRKRGGLWLLRIEDVDLERSRTEHEQAILMQIERHGLYWDGPVIRQSDRAFFYHRAILELASKGLVYRCKCTRKFLKSRGCFESSEGELIYPGICRPLKPVNFESPTSESSASLRFLIQDGEYEFADDLAGFCKGSLADEIGDFVLKRADGCFTYHLAVVVDDFLQGVTRVVRGRDILSLTGRHVVLQKALGYRTPEYAHIPLVLGNDGKKLSKSASARAIAETSPEINLKEALNFLGVEVDLTDFSSVDEIIQHAILNYNFT